MTTIGAGQTSVVASSSVSGVLVAGGLLLVEAGGEASGTTVEAGTVTAISGGMISGTLISGSGFGFISVGGIASDTTVDGGTAVAFVVVGGGVADGTVVNGGGFGVAGGVASDTTIGSKGFAQVSAGGSADNTVVESGGGLNVLNGGAASGVTVSSGGELEIFAGGRASDVGVDGSAFVFTGGVASNATIGSGAAMFVFSGGTVSNATVSAGGFLLAPNGTVSGSVASSGAFIELSVSTALGQWNAAGPNIVDGATIESGAIAGLEIQSTGSISGFIAVSGGFLDVSAGATASGTVIESGATLFLDGGTASGTDLESGGVIDLDGIVAKSAVLDSGVLSLTLAHGGTLDLSLSGVPANALFKVATDHFGGTDITISSAVGNPTIATPKKGVTLDPGKTAKVAGISIAEKNAHPFESYTVTVADANGLLSASGAGGAVVTAPGSTSVTVTGSLKQVNAALKTLTDTDHVAGSESLTINATDSLDDSATPALVAVTVGAPIVSIPRSPTLTTGKATHLGGISLKETGASPTASFTLTLTDTNGILSATGAGVSGGGTSLTITGTLAHIGAALSKLSDDDMVAGPDTITLTATDSFGNTSTKELAVTASAAHGTVRIVPEGLSGAFIHAKGSPAKAGAPLADMVRQPGVVVALGLTQLPASRPAAATAIPDASSHHSWLFPPH
jgi:autotransporter passenger strand-loop-strand repeat protein